MDNEGSVRCGGSVHGHLGVEGACMDIEVWRECAWTLRCGGSVHGQ